METLAIIIVVIYAVSLLFIFSYSIIQLNLAITYLKAKAAGKKKESLQPALLSVFPIVTVQLPVYNELYVIDRRRSATELP